MPIGLGLGTAIGAGISAIGSIFSNRKNRRFADEQRRKSFQDNVDFWNMQNAYNTPERQMQRFKDAGLNPNLIYGQGNAGNAGAIQSPDAQKMQYKNVGEQAGPMAADFITQLYNVRQMQAATDKLKADATVSENTAALLGIRQQSEALDYMQKGELYSTNVDYRKGQYRQLTQDIDLAKRADMRAEIQLGRNVKESIQRVLKSKEDVLASQVGRRKAELIMKGIASDNAVKELDKYFADRKIRPQDPFYAHAITTLIDTITKKLQDGAGTRVKQKVSDKITEKFPSSAIPGNTWSTIRMLLGF